MTVKNTNTRMTVGPEGLRKAQHPDTQTKTKSNKQHTEEKEHIQPKHRK